MAAIVGSFANDFLVSNYQEDDEIYGLAGNDTISYGTSWGEYEASYGNDIIDGGSGSDTLRFYKGADIDRPVPEIFVDLQAGIAELEGGVTLTLSGIENVYLGGYWGHEAWGNQFANRLTASLGDDALYGAGGADILQGASGNDTLDGGGGDDILEGGWHDDTLIGGAGVDTALFGAEGEDMVVDLALGTAVGQGSDTLTQIENVTTGDGGDWIGGSDVANVLLAGDGNDEVHGLGGNDQLEGGSGHDTLTGGADNDTMLGGSDNDTLNGEGGNDTLNGGSGFDIVDGGTGIDTLTGFHHVDNFVFALGDSSIGAGFRHVITDFSTV